MFIHLPQFCLKSLQLLLQRSNRLNCFEQCPCGTCQRHQGQDDVHDTGTHWPKDRQQVRYPWRKISGHWPNSMASHWLTLAWMIMKYHECTYALWTLQCVAICTWLISQNPFEIQSFQRRNCPSCRTFALQNLGSLNPSELWETQNVSSKTFPKTGTLEPSRNLPKPTLWKHSGTFQMKTFKDEKPNPNPKSQGLKGKKLTRERFPKTQPKPCKVFQAIQLWKSKKKLRFHESWLRLNMVSNA